MLDPRLSDIARAGHLIVGEKLAVCNAVTQTALEHAEEKHAIVELAPHQEEFHAKEASIEVLKFIPWPN